MEKRRLHRIGWNSNSLNNFTIQVSTKIDMQLTEIKQADAHAGLPIVRYFYKLLLGGGGLRAIKYSTYLMLLTIPRAVQEIGGLWGVAFTHKTNFTFFLLAIPSTVSLYGITLSQSTTCQQRTLYSFE
jgi:hypothetical protein